jgi:hypothetical protein
MFAYLYLRGHESTGREPAEFDVCVVDCDVYKHMYMCTHALVHMCVSVLVCTCAHTSANILAVESGQILAVESGQIYGR